MQVEWDSKKSEKRNVRDALKGRNVQVPQQTNYSDCGVYVLQYAECFFYVSMKSSIMYYQKYLIFIQSAK